VLKILFLLGVRRKAGKEEVKVMTRRKVGVVALIIVVPPHFEEREASQRSHRPHLSPILIDQISDEREIQVFEEALASGAPHPLTVLRNHREKEALEDEEFGRYVEDLLCQPFLKPEIQRHGVEWLKSRIKIEQFREQERRAAASIAEYAFQLYLEDPDQQDYLLAGPNAQVRIRIFEIPQMDSRKNVA
jgi:hypothetical protein